MTVDRIQTIAIGSVASSAAVITVMPFVGGPLASKLFGFAVLALAPALAGVALRRTTSPRRAALVLIVILIVFEAAGFYVVGFSGAPLPSLALMAGLAITPLIVLGSLYAWLERGTADESPHG